ncbi:MAG: sigma-70 family RNA polymerase sigma factor, partial [Sphingobacteriaceae bacterium]|nr:sigma-70 family RNA polymerase sigma factor [Cytophagaceae bacterium]
RTFVPYACQRSAISTDDALDLLQEGLAEFAVKLKAGKYTFQGSAVTAYVFTVCRNRWVSFLKKKRLPRADPSGEDPADEGDDAPAPFAFLSENEADSDDERGTDPADRDSSWEDAEVDWEAVNRAFAESSEDCRTMLTCFYVEEKSLGECAGRIGLQENSGKVKRFRCAQRMKTLYSQYKIA